MMTAASRYSLSGMSPCGSARPEPFREAFPFLVLGDEVHEKGVPVLAEHDAGVLVDPNHHSSIRRIVAVRMRGRPVPASVGRDGAVGHDVYRNGISG